MTKGKKIKVVVDREGKVATDFDGFLGDTCFEEAAKLREELRRLGVEVEPENVARKPPKTAETQEIPQRAKEKQ